MSTRTDMGLIVDLFAGGGGASLGIEMALGRAVDVAINHNPEAVAIHAATPWRCRPQPVATIPRHSLNGLERIPFDEYRRQPLPLFEEGIQ